MPVTVLQSGDVRRALLVRTDGTRSARATRRAARAAPLAPLAYTDPADDINTYQGQATLPLDL